MISYHKIQIEDCNVFYRVAGNPESPTLLLLHGFPSFGQTESPSRSEFEYTFGTPEGSVGADGNTLDYYYVNLHERAEMQNDLIFDYQSNVRLYPEFQKYFREHQPRLLAVWGKNDPSFIPAGYIREF